MRLGACAVLMLVSGSFEAAALEAMSTGFPVTNDVIPGDWTGSVFTPNFDFPAEKPQAEELPWANVDPKTRPEEFMYSVLGYVLEGMDRATWDGRTNTVRQWYHAPWMHETVKGREFVHGLTRERSSRLGELGPLQSRCYQNWAVSLINPIGAHTYWQVWGDGSLPPNPSAAKFEVGTVNAKLLFTHAPATEVPFLKGSPEWDANIVDVDISSVDCPEKKKRSVKTLRLFQFDIAVSVPATVSPSGWIYGTFVYDGRNGSSDPWENLLPVGLMWGNDPQAFQGASPGPLVEGVVLRDFGLNRNFGRDGRMNGPVDNPASSCLSCHSTAQYPTLADMAPPRDAPDDLAACWFRNLVPNEAFGREPSATVACGEQTTQPSVALGTSLQLAAGLSNYARVTGANLSERLPANLLSLEAGRQEAAMQNWMALRPDEKAIGLSGPALDAGRFVFPVTRGD